MLNPDRVSTRGRCGGGVGIGAGVAALDVSVEPDKEDGMLMADMERELNGFLSFALDLASFCGGRALANLNLAVSGSLSSHLIRLTETLQETMAGNVIVTVSEMVEELVSEGSSDDS